jgi:hypothetical protein
MTQVLKLTLTKADLDKIPPDERQLYLMGGLVLNDINTLSKLVIIAMRTPQADEMERWGAMTQSFLLVKLFAGRLFEGHELIKNIFLGKKMRQKYIDELSQKAQLGLTELNRYFGRKNSVEIVRNTFAFHMGAGEIASEYESLPPDVPLVDVLCGDYLGFNLFYGAEMLAFGAISAKLGKPDIATALDMVVGDTVQVAVWIGNFMTAFLDLMRSKYIGVAETDIEPRSVSREVSISDMQLPFFVGPPPTP